MLVNSANAGEEIDDSDAYLAEPGSDVEVGSDGAPPWLE